MVLFGTVSSPASLQFNLGFTSLRIEASNKKFDIFSISCIACKIRNAMASIPPSAFSAGKIRKTQHSENNRDMQISKTAKTTESTKFFDTSFLELTPLKYNSKLMNSIWGLYNRYSPHNVKKINDANAFPAAGEQSPANKSEATIILPSKLDNVWAAMNVSQSH